MNNSIVTVSIRSKLKIVFLGDQGAGKSSIINRYINNTFRPNQDPTVGVDFLGKNITHNSKELRLQLWDTAGQERFRSLIPNYLRDAVCAVFIFDLANLQTAAGLTKWMELFQDHRAQHSVTVLCGNKKDLKNDFDRSKIDELLIKYPMPYIQVSALTGEGVDKLFEIAIDQLSAKTNILGNNVEQQQFCVIPSKPIRLPHLLSTAVFHEGIDLCGTNCKRKGRCC